MKQKPKHREQEVVDFGAGVRYTKKFLHAWRRLSGQKKQTVKNKVMLLVANPGHPSLRTHRLHRAEGEVWECYLLDSFPHRLLYQYQGDTVLLVEMGSHQVVNQCHIRRFEKKRDEKTQ